MRGFANKKALPRLLIISACGIASAEDPQFVLRLANGAPNYFRVPIPDGATELTFSLEADRPVAMMVGSKYFPSESHYDFANFPDWATGESRHQSWKSSLKLPVGDLLENPCDAGEPGAIEFCLSRAAEGGGIRCGRSVPVGASAAAAAAAAAAGLSVEAENGDLGFPSLGGEIHSSSHAQTTSPRGTVQLFGGSEALDRTGGFCQKYVDTCQHGLCSSDRGPAVCRNSTTSAAASGENECFCQRGYCEVDGFCVGADLMEPGCMKVTGHLCPDSSCASSMGPAICEDGLCVCQPGHCSVDGMCQPGPLCGELSHRGLCPGHRTVDSSTPAWSVVSTPESPQQALHSRRLGGVFDGAQARKDAECCRRLDTARTVAPGQFARCLARRFFGLDALLRKGVHVPLLGHDASDKASGRGELGAEAVVCLTSKANRSSDSAVSDVRFTIRALGAGPSGSLVDATKENVDQSPTLIKFHTLQELVAPAWLGPHRVAPLQQFEAALLWLDPGAADSPAATNPPFATALRLKHGEPLLLRLADEVEGGVGAGGGKAPGGSGVLNLHVVGLPAGSSVLYARSWPEPRSLMDFEHATLISSNPASGVWRATELNTRYFAILPSASMDQNVYAFFALHGVPTTAPRGYSQRPSRPPRFAPSVFAAPSATTAGTSAMASEGGSVDDATSVFVLNIVIIVLFLAAAYGVWLRRRGSRGVAGGDVDTHYAAVASSDQFLDLGDSADHAHADDLGDDTPTQARARASSFHEALCSISGVVKEGFSTRLLSVSTRFSSTARTAESTSRSAWDGCDSIDGRGVSAVGVASFFARAAAAPRVGNHPNVGSGGPHTAEEARGLLDAADEDDEEDLECVRRGHRRDGSMLDDADMDSMDSLLKLRPAACDSIGDGAFDEDPSPSPLVGSERAMYLSR